ncbi:MAG TPA: hypothetical protein VFR21_09680 [Bradyrhizobium sp.]|nr:hypothetical protein [Bradyrhizobium sp.]
MAIDDLITVIARRANEGRGACPAVMLFERNADGRLLVGMSAIATGRTDGFSQPGPTSCLSMT